MINLELYSAKLISLKILIIENYPNLLNNIQAKPISDKYDNIKSVIP